MTDLAKKTLEIMRSETGKSSYSYLELSKFGFSESESQIAFRELEQAGYIYKDDTYVSGTPKYKLN